MRLSFQVRGRGQRSVGGVRAEKPTPSLSLASAARRRRGGRCGTGTVVTKVRAERGGEVNYARSGRQQQADRNNNVSSAGAPVDREDSGRYNANSSSRYNSAGGPTRDRSNSPSQSQSQTPRNVNGIGEVRERERGRGGARARQGQSVGMGQRQRRPQQQQQRRYNRDAEPVFVQRSALLSKPVITRTSGTNLGVVNQLWVDTSQWKVVALDVRPNMFFGEMDSVLLDKLKQIGDVILVHDESDAQSHIVLYGLNYLVGSEVVTEVGGYLGKVRDYTFNPEDGQVTQIHFDALGAPAVPSSVLSTYSVSCSEIVNVGPDRVVVASGAESRVQQLSSGVMQRLALYEPPWEAAYRDQYEMDYYALPPYQEQYNTNRMMPPPPPQQQYQNYNSNYNTQQQPVQAREMNTMNTRAEPTGSTYNSYQGGGGYSRQMPQPRQASSQPQPQPQKRYDDFIEVQEDPPEPEPVYEAQIQQNMQREQSSSSSSSSSGQTPSSASGRGGYNKDEDRL